MNGSAFYVLSAYFVCFLATLFCENVWKIMAKKIKIGIDIVAQIMYNNYNGKICGVFKIRRCFLGFLVRTHTYKIGGLNSGLLVLQPRI